MSEGRSVAAAVDIEFVISTCSGDRGEQVAEFLGRAIRTGTLPRFCGFLAACPKTDGMGDEHSATMRLALDLALAGLDGCVATGSGQHGLGSWVEFGDVAVTLSRASHGEILIVSAATHAQGVALRHETVRRFPLTQAGVLAFLTTVPVGDPQLSEPGDDNDLLRRLWEAAAALRGGKAPRPS